MNVEKSKKRFCILLGAAVCVAMLQIVSIGSAAGWPEKGKILTMYIPSGSGGASDMAGRAIAQALEKELDMKVVIINKGGGASQIGTTEYMLKAGTDGYTILATMAPISQPPYMDPARQATYGSKDFLLVANYAYSSQAIAVKKGGPYKSLKDVVEAARANPGKIKGTASGPLSVSDMAMVMLEQATGIQFAHMFFDQQGEQRASLLGGHTDVEFNFAFELRPGQQGGEIETLAIFGSEPVAYLPGVPTAASLGYPVNISGGFGLVYKTGTPKEIVDVVVSAVQRGVKRKDIQDIFNNKLSLDIRVMTGQDYANYWKYNEDIVAKVLANMKKK